MYSVTYSSTLEFTCDPCKYLLMCVLSTERQNALSLDYFIVQKKVIQTRLLCLLGYRIQRHLKECTDIKQCIYQKMHVTEDNLPYVMMISSGREIERDFNKYCMFLCIKIWEPRSYFPLKYSPPN